MKKVTGKIKLFDRAQTMVEFALVLPLLAVLIFGVLEVGRMAFLYSTIATASREAVRYGSATGDVATGNTNKRYADCAGIRAAAQRVDFLNVITDANILITYDHGPGTTWSGALCPVGGTGPSAISSGDRIRVIVSGNFNPIVGLVPLSARTITSSNYHTILGSVSIPQTPVGGGSSTAIPTSANTVVPTATTQTPAATTVPTVVTTVAPPTCGAITATTPVIAADLKSVTWTITNATPVYLNTVTATWPTGSGNLTSLEVDGTFITAFSAAVPTTKTLSVGRTLTAGSHPLVFSFSNSLNSGDFSVTTTFTTAGCIPVSGSSPVYIITHPIPYPVAVNYTAGAWKLTNHTGTNFQIAHIDFTWNNGSCKSNEDLTVAVLGSNPSKSFPDNGSQCTFYSFVPSPAWTIPPGESNMMLTFAKKGTVGITVKIYLVGSSYIVDSTNPLQKD